MKHLFTELILFFMRHSKHSLMSVLWKLVLNCKLPYLLFYKPVTALKWDHYVNWGKGNIRYCSFQSLAFTSNCA